MAERAGWGKIARDMRRYEERHKERYERQAASLPK